MPMSFNISTQASFKQRPYDREQRDSAATVVANFRNQNKVARRETKAQDDRGLISRMLGR